MLFSTWGNLHPTYCYHFDSCSCAYLFSLPAILAFLMSDAPHTANALDCSALYIREGLFIITAHFCFSTSEVKSLYMCQHTDRCMYAFQQRRDFSKSILST